MSTSPMPTVRAWIDDLRAAFGSDLIDGQIRAGMRGEPVFCAQEAGRTVGTPVPTPVGVKLADMVVYGPRADAAQAHETGRRRAKRR